MPDRDQLGKKKHLLSKKGRKTDHVKVWTSFKRLLAYVTWSCASTHSLNLYCDGKTECPWFSTHPQPQESSEGHKAQHPTTLRHTHTHLYQKEAVWIWAPRGLGKRLKPWLPTKRALQTLTPAASVSRFASWLGLFAFLRHTQGGVCLLSSCKIQLPKIYNQLLQCCAHHLLSQRSETSQQSISAAKRQLWKPDFTISFGKS